MTSVDEIERMYAGRSASLLDGLSSALLPNSADGRDPCDRAGYRTMARKAEPLNDGERIRILHVITGLYVGGSEMMLSNLVKRHKASFAPMVVSLRETGPWEKT